MDYIIRKAESDSDIVSIAKCAEITWHSAYDDLLPEGQVDYMIKKFQSREVLQHDISENGYVYFIAENNGKILGYCGVRPEIDKLFISKIYVLPEFQRNGIATAFVNKVFSAYSNYKTFYLTVNKYNKKAVAAYKHFGFTEADAVVTDIGDGYVMDDYIMEYTL